MTILETTTDIADDATAELQSDLAEIFTSSPRRSSVALLSGSAPSWVAIISDILSWQTVLKASVGVFCAELSKHAAGDVWKNRGEIAIALKTAGASVVRRFASLFARTKARLPESSVRIGLPCGANSSAQLALPSTEEEIAAALAIFVAKVGEIDDVLKDIATRTSIPIHLSLTEDGAIVVAWLKSGDENWSEIRLGPPDICDPHKKGG
jgi:hypothetical protein